MGSISLTDVVMPRMSGKALAETVRERHPDYTLASYGVSGGQADFLQKPFALNTLAGLAREVLDRAWCPDFEVR